MIIEHLSDGGALTEITGATILLEQVFRLRVDVWRGLVNIPKDVVRWSDEYDGAGRHFAIVTTDRIVAAVRITFHKAIGESPDAAVYPERLISSIYGPIASYNRMVVHQKYQGRGYSGLLDALCIDVAQKAGCTCLLGATGSVAENKRRIHSMVKRGFTDEGVGLTYPASYFSNYEPPNILVYRY